MKTYPRGSNQDQMGAKTCKLLQRPNLQPNPKGMTGLSEIRMISIRQWPTVSDATASNINAGWHSAYRLRLYGRQPRDTSPGQGVFS